MNTSPTLHFPSHEGLEHATAAEGLLGLAERGLLPDAVVRLGIRRQCAARLREESAGGLAAQESRLQERLALLRGGELAVHTQAANAQHYELPSGFFEHCLGPRLKYSCAYYPRGDESLAEAEEAMLALYAERAQLADGMDVLELGCGWGSLTLWMAARYPRMRIVAVSNSAEQRRFIESRCRALALDNVHVMTADINRLTLPAAAFDRCVSIEMFEHLRNYELLMARIAQWLRPDGKLFVHIFAHRTHIYLFETHGSDNWMGRHFFTGGLMPGADTLLWFSDHLSCEQRWLLDGSHYQRTANDWLRNQDRHGTAVRAILSEAYGARAALWQQRWRMFWMACAECFGYAGGREWLVAHYRFTRRR
ncbi:MAG: class I SAM-dependent methyltransferase [Proteobacteria bacterium]|nr:class I SAM-dependent methyltransferase [Pseudomonadota bacterium]